MPERTTSVLRFALERDSEHRGRQELSVRSQAAIRRMQARIHRSTRLWSQCGLSIAFLLVVSSNVAQASSACWERRPPRTRGGQGASLNYRTGETACAPTTDSTRNARLEDYEGRPIVAVELTFENSPADQAAQSEFLSLLKVASGTEVSAVRVR